MNQVYQKPSTGYDFDGIYGFMFQNMIQKLSTILRTNAA